MNSLSPAIRGLSSSEAQDLLKKGGRNELPRPQRDLWLKWVKRFLAPIPLMLIAAAVFSFILGKNFDGYFILALFLVNLGISIWHEWKTDNALKILEKSVSLIARTVRDGIWQGIDSKELVPGDVIELVAGSVVPADAAVIEANAASANESMLTGESLPVDKKAGDALFTGSYLASGIVRAQITTTGANTRFGSTIARDDGERRPSALEKDILTISKFLSGISIALASVFSVALLAAHQNIFEIIRLDLTLLIAGIPVALPVVMSLIISVGVLELSKKGAIVRRLAALEDLANVNLLLSDKTGTLTKNEIRVHALSLLSSYDETAVAAFAAATAVEVGHHALEQAVVAYAQKLHAENPYSVLEIVPPDSARKRSTVLLKGPEGLFRVSLGAPQVIRSLCTLNGTQEKRFDDIVSEAGVRGFRVLALAVRQASASESAPPEKDMEPVGIFLLSDELREDAKDVIAFLVAHGVGVKILTGDNIAISREIAGKLLLTGKVVSCHDGDVDTLSEEDFNATSVFSEILPEDKKRLVALAEKRAVVAVTGDGINDLPAIRSADVGIAVANAVDALKETADMVLVQSGIGVIRDAVIAARQIFARIYSYSIYRISESFRLIITVAFFGIFFLMPILTPLQLIILALLNDLPIISLAFNRVKVSLQPTSINARKRFILSTLYGSIGILNSILFFYIATGIFHLPWETVQTLFFLKLTVSGHMLIYVAHTPVRWYSYLPSKTVILATTLTQLVATLIATFGIFMAGAPFAFVIAVWVWSFIWMQVSDAMKIIHHRLGHAHTVALQR